MISFHNAMGPAERIVLKRCLAIVFSALIGLSWGTSVVLAQQPDNEAPGSQVLTRGPVHEAFAGTITFNPEPGMVAPKAPPAIIEELPPEERPEGDNVSWIPGYWAWDDERSDFLWVSGTWRALPPGREWMAGYWGQTPQGYQWTSGYWADAAARETTYLPPPPATVEVGPNIAAPSVDFGWSPGCWVWYQERYAWRPGYWAEGRADWDWTPAHYVWTPRGYIFVGGFWDYPVYRRGVIFAPVYFESGVYARHGFSYSPTIVISLDVFSEHLFVRPHYHHYYFGDYYAPSYFGGGFYASFSFQSSRHGYDPIYSHQRWEHRRDREWEHHVEASYRDRRDHESSRPPRTWVAQRSGNPGTTGSRENHAQLAAPIEQLARQKDSSVRFQPVAREERLKLARRGDEVQQSREQRRTVEAGGGEAPARTPGAAIEPTRVALPRSPIVARSVSQLGRNQAPPETQRAPKPDLKHQPKPAPLGRSQGGDGNNAPSLPRQPELQKQPSPGRNPVAPRDRPAQTDSRPRGPDSGAKVQDESQSGVQGLEQKAQRESKQRADDAAAKARDESQRNAPRAEQNPQRESEPGVKGVVVRTPEPPQANARGVGRRLPEPAARQRGYAGEKGVSRLMRPEARTKGEGTQTPRKSEASP